jgi:hypothetical protein
MPEETTICKAAKLLHSIQTHLNFAITGVVVVTSTDRTERTFREGIQPQRRPRFKCSLHAKVNKSRWHLDTPFNVIFPSPEMQYQREIER